MTTSLETVWAFVTSQLIEDHDRRALDDLQGKAIPGKVIQLLSGSLP